MSSMESEVLLESINSYKNQLSEINLALDSNDSAANTIDLISLRNDITQLIELTQENLDRIVNQGTSSHGSNHDPLADEFTLFMSEMEKEGAVQSKADQNSLNVQNELKSLEGMKCRAPHQHQWGDVMYHNALVCSVIPSETVQSFEEIEVKVMFINPTHEEMLPCPYLMDSNCKFTDEKCKYSHGEIVLFSSLQEYSGPNFEQLVAGCKVLAKYSNKLWNRAIIKRVYGEKCLVKFDSDQKDYEILLQDVLPLYNDNDDIDNDSASENDDREDVINMSLMNTPSSQALGDWEKHTKGIGSKIMGKMGYIIGTGLGPLCDGRVEPVTAVALPPGKSLDHCMILREKSGGNKDLFSVEKKLKRLQRKQIQQGIKAYEREKKKVNVFNFLNETLSNKKAQSVALSKSKHRQEIKKESSRNLNVASLKTDEDIKRVERDMIKIRESLSRHSDVRSSMHKSLKEKLSSKQNELHMLQTKALNISLEQRTRNDKKKLTVF